MEPGELQPAGWEPSLAARVQGLRQAERVGRVDRAELKLPCATSPAVDL